MSSLSEKCHVNWGFSDRSWWLSGHVHNHFYKTAPERSHWWKWQLGKYFCYSRQVDFSLLMKLLSKQASSGSQGHS